MPGIAEKIKSIRENAGGTIDTLGQTGAFGLAGGAITHLVDPTLGRKVTEIQTVYDTFGREATTNLLASRALQHTLKKLPAAAQRIFRSGAKRMTQASPLIRGVLRLAETVATKV